jgi:TrmH family RNA methyltransferase
MIESLHSPHVGRVKALIGSRGSKERRESGFFVAEGAQSLREAVTSTDGPRIETLYLTHSGAARVSDLALETLNIVEVNDAVMAEMASTITPQGILAVCAIPDRSLATLVTKKNSTIIYLDRIQDPGNAGTILRSADAFGMCAVVTSPGSVDMYSPKVVRATAGSLWHIPVFQDVALDELVQTLDSPELLLLSSHATTSIQELHISQTCVAIFGNEAQGTTPDILGVTATSVTIPMVGRAESLNLSAAASIVMFTLSTLSHR